MEEQKDKKDDILLGGEIISDRMVISCTKTHERIPGDTLASWVAICFKSEELHPYVVWNIYATETGFRASSGDYCTTVAEAIQHYQARGGILESYTS